MYEKIAICPYGIPIIYNSVGINLLHQFIPLGDEFLIDFRLPGSQFYISD